MSHINHKFSYTQLIILTTLRGDSNIAINRTYIASGNDEEKHINDRYLHFTYSDQSELRKNIYKINVRVFHTNDEI